MAKRFTIDGNAELEERLQRTCREVVDRLTRLLPAGKLQAIVLGGGYGRGQGGVFQEGDRQLPYNDLEFYVFLRGNPTLNERAFATAVERVAEQLSPSAGLHVEFKIDSLDRFRRAPISMFSYDLVAAHRVLHGEGEADLFAGCGHHLIAEQIPDSEATRLLFNRCSGLLLVKDLLRARVLTPDQADFAGRNLAKARLAFGDALLTAFHQYHWSVLERRRRLAQLAPPALPGIEQVIDDYAEAVEFKLHPCTFEPDVDHFRHQHASCANQGLQLWLWLESRRLQHPFQSSHQYAFYAGSKCDGSPWSRNLLLNLRTFGVRAVLQPMAKRYPRERLFNALALLLWDGELHRDREVQRHLQRQLVCKASNWEDLVAAYKQIWPRYG